MPTFRTKTNHLTPYAFACGYIEDKQLPEGKYLKMFHDGCYTVRAWQRTNGNLVCLAWETFPTLTAARKYFDAFR